ncbi:hypothetical protein C8Q70DRAFT_261221 [Cubamyces menziesii]|nr:hypothetical protein C8Q70DRAFT_261221 [Cubamyces menziesii]
MPRGLTLQPLELLPEWLTESPITAEDLRCTTPASTIFRMSFGGSGRLRHRESATSIASSATTSTATASGSESDEEESDGGSFLWDNEESDDDDDSDTIEEPSPEPSRSAAHPSKPSPESTTQPTPAPTAAHPSHTRTPSAQSPNPTTAPPAPYDTRAPWYLHFDPACLSALDDQLLQSPLDAFADLCYAHAVQSRSAAASPEARAAAVLGGYSWRRLSRLLSACPDLGRAGLDFSSASASTSARASASADVDTVTGTQRARAAAGERGRGRESDSDSDDSDSEGLASPEQSAPMQGWACSVYQPGVERQQAESPYRPYASHTLISKPLPALPSRASSCSPSPPPPAPLSPPLSPPARLTCSPPPLYMPPPAVSQAQLALLFTNAPPRPGESVHFFPRRTQQLQRPQHSQYSQQQGQQQQGQQQRQGQGQGQRKQQNGQNGARRGTHESTPSQDRRRGTAPSHRQGDSFSSGESLKAPWSPSPNSSPNSTQNQNHSQGARPNLFQRGLAGIGIRAGLSH